MSDLTISGSFSHYCRRVCSHTKKWPQKVAILRCKCPIQFQSQLLKPMTMMVSVRGGWFFGKPRNLCKSLDVCLIQWLGWVCCCIVLTCESNLGYDHSHLGQWKTGTSKNNIAFSCTRKGHFLQNDMILCGTVGHREKNWHIIIHIRNHSESFQPRGDQATPFINFGLKNPI